MRILSPVGIVGLQTIATERQAVHVTDSQREEINRLVAEFDRAGVSRQVGYDRLHLYSIITHSTAIEGSTISFEDNELMFDEGIVPAGHNVHEQMMNLDLKKAYDVAIQLVDAQTSITPLLLRSLSAIVMRNTGSTWDTANGSYDEAQGDFRLQNVRAGRGGASYLAWEKVESRVDELCSWLDGRVIALDEASPAEIYELSFEAHYRLVTIHPWSDGNGRMARLLMNMVQMRGRIVPSYVRSECKAAYITALRESRTTSSSRPDLEFMAHEVISVLCAELQEYLESLEQNVPWADGR